MSLTHCSYEFVVDEFPQGDTHMAGLASRALAHARYQNRSHRGMDHLQQLPLLQLALDAQHKSLSVRSQLRRRKTSIGAIDTIDIIDAVGATETIHSTDTVELVP